MPEEILEVKPKASKQEIRNNGVNFALLNLNCPQCHADALERIGTDFIVCNNCDVSYKIEKDGNGKNILWR